MSRRRFLFFLAFLLLISLGIKSQATVVCDWPEGGSDCFDTGCGVGCGKTECLNIWAECELQAKNECSNCLKGCTTPSTMAACQQNCQTPLTEKAEECKKAGKARKLLIQANPCADMYSPSDCQDCAAKKPCELTKKQLPKADKRVFTEHASKHSQTINPEGGSGGLDVGKAAGFLSSFAQLFKSDAGDTGVSGGGPYFPTTNPDGTINFGGNEYQVRDFQFSKTFDTSTGTLISSKGGEVVKVLPGNNKIGFSPLGGGVQDAAGSLLAAVPSPNPASAFGLNPSGMIIAPERNMQIAATGELGDRTPNLLTGAAVMGRIPPWTSVRFFPREPAQAGFADVHVGFIPPAIVKIVPRSNVKIDFFANRGLITSLIQQMGVPRGMANMVSESNVGARSKSDYLIVGLKDYDFTVSHGMVRWIRSGTPGGKIIASSFGVPPGQYLSAQQRELVYAASG